MSGDERCGRCPHPKRAHALPPQYAICRNCAATKEYKLNAPHVYRSELEQSLR